MVEIKVQFSFCTEDAAWLGWVPSIILEAVQTIDEMGSMLSELGERKFYAAT